MKIPAHAKYQIIYDTLQKNDNLLNVAAMCEIAGVSRSGYYHYLSTEDQRMEREERDRQCLSFYVSLHTISFNILSYAFRNVKKMHPQLTLKMHFYNLFNFFIFSLFLNRRQILDSVPVRPLPLLFDLRSIY